MFKSLCSGLDRTHLLWKLISKSRHYFRFYFLLKHASGVSCMFGELMLNIISHHSQHWSGISQGGADAFTKRQRKLSAVKVNIVHNLEPSARELTWEVLLSNGFNNWGAFCQYNVRHLPNSWQGFNINRPFLCFAAAVTFEVINKLHVLVSVSEVIQLQRFSLKICIKSFWWNKGQKSLLEPVLVELKYNTARSCII